MGTQAQCWKCGAAVDDLLLAPGRRVARLAECPNCRAELHICRACVFYDTRVARQCRETIAEEVKDKTRANFCDYFQYREDAYQPGDIDAAEAARRALESRNSQAAVQHVQSHQGRCDAKTTGGIPAFK